MNEEIKKNDRDFEINQLNEKTNEFINKKQLENAEEYARKVLEIDSKNSTAWSNLAALYN